MYVFCGINNKTKKYTNSIERLITPVKGDSQWEIINVSTDLFQPRQGNGVCQMNKDEILVFGGYNGAFMKDAYIFNHQQKTMKAADFQPGMELFAFQMPTVYEESTGSVYTVDWQKQMVIQYRQMRWSVLADFKKLH